MALAQKFIARHIDLNGGTNHEYTDGPARATEAEAVTDLTAAEAAHTGAAADFEGKVVSVYKSE